MSESSNYNTRARASEVLVEGNEARLIRRRETLRDLMAAEICKAIRMGGRTTIPVSTSRPEVWM